MPDLPALYPANSYTSISRVFLYVNDGFGHSKTHVAFEIRDTIVIRGHTGDHSRLAVHETYHGHPSTMDL
jgi:hypothetical protein